MAESLFAGRIKVYDLREWSEIEIEGDVREENGVEIAFVTNLTGKAAWHREAARKRLGDHRRRVADLYQRAIDRGLDACEFINCATESDDDEEVED